MNTITTKELTAYTHFDEKVCLCILNVIEKGFGEIGDFLIEDDSVSFSVYRGYFEEAPKIIKMEGGKIELRLIEKFDDPFYSVCYNICIPKALPNGKH